MYSCSERLALIDSSNASRVDVDEYLYVVVTAHRLCRGRALQMPFKIPRFQRRDPPSPFTDSRGFRQRRITDLRNEYLRATPDEYSPAREAETCALVGQRGRNRV